MQTLHRIDRALGALAAVTFVAAVVGFGAALPGYEALRHPVALLGASGVPHAQAFSWLGFVLPGLLTSVVAVRLLLRVPRTSPWTMRVGVQLLVLAGFGLAAMGLLPLDASDIQNRASQFHASAWMVWVLAFVPGTVMYGLGALRVTGWRASALLHLGCGGAMVLAAFVLQAWMPAPLAQRLAFGCWLVWLVAALPTAHPRR